MLLKSKALTGTTNIKVRFPKDEDMNAELLVLDQLFDVE